MAQKEIEKETSVRLRMGPDNKDLVIFATKEDHSVPSTVSLPEPEPSPGLILANGDINWNCPCLGGMATGPCGVQFREAFSCFHYSEGEPKGSDCYEAFSTMQECMAKFPTLYNKEAGDEEDPMKFEGLEEKNNELQISANADTLSAEKGDGTSTAKK